MFDAIEFKVRPDRDNRVTCVMGEARVSMCEDISDSVLRDYRNIAGKLVNSAKRRVLKRIELAIFGEALAKLHELKRYTYGAMGGVHPSDIVRVTELFGELEESLSLKGAGSNDIA